MICHTTDTDKILDLLGSFCKDSEDKVIRDVPKWVKFYIYHKTKMGLLYLGDLSGFLLYFESKKHLLLAEMAIKPLYRKKGFGTELFKAFKDLAKERDKERIKWYCEINSPANEFYKSLGYEPGRTRDKKGRTEYVYEVDLFTARLS